MRIPFRCHVKPNGLPKRKFPTQTAADDFAKRQGGVHSYQCPLCEAWHLATDSQPRRKAS